MEHILEVDSLNVYYKNKGRKDGALPVGSFGRSAAAYRDCGGTAVRYNLFNCR